jgi:hypothetical protein
MNDLERIAALGQVDPSKIGDAMLPIVNSPDSKQFTGKGQLGLDPRGPKPISPVTEGGVEVGSVLQTMTPDNNYPEPADTTLIVDLRPPPLPPITDEPKPAEKPFDMHELVPANWKVLARLGGTIQATNATTGREFNGSREEFSRLLRGK